MNSEGQSATLFARVRSERVGVNVSVDIEQGAGSPSDVGLRGEMCV